MTAWFGGGVGKDGVLSVPSPSLTRVIDLRQEKTVCGEMTDWAKVTCRLQACRMGVKELVGVFRGGEGDFDRLQDVCPFFSFFVCLLRDVVDTYCLLSISNSR